MFHRLNSPDYISKKLNSDLKAQIVVPAPLKVVVQMHVGQLELLLGRKISLADWVNDVFVERIRRDQADIEKAGLTLDQLLPERAGDLPDLTELIGASSR